MKVKFFSLAICVGLCFPKFPFTEKTLKNQDNASKSYSASGWLADSLGSGFQIMRDVADLLKTSKWGSGVRHRSFAQWWGRFFAFEPQSFTCRIKALSFEQNHLGTIPKKCQFVIVCFLKVYLTGKHYCSESGNGVWAHNLCRKLVQGFYCGTLTNQPFSARLQRSLTVALDESCY